MMDRSCSDLPWHVRLLALKLMGRTLKFGAALFNALICSTEFAFNVLCPLVLDAFHFRLRKLMKQGGISNA
jgi:hypothetical protein